MKYIWREIVMAVIMGMVLPGILQNWPLSEKEMVQPNLILRPAQQEAVRIPLQMKLRKQDGTVETMDMDAYLMGVILAEMPSNFEAEAKKAQAVAARTYARKASVTGGKHGDGSVCESASCCQAYISPENYLQQGGTEKALIAAKSAADATSGLVMTYDGQLIEATYFSCSGGSTEDAVAVWGTDYPYLRSVESPGEEHAVHNTDTVYFSKSDFENALDLSLRGSPESWIGKPTYTSGNGIDAIVIGGHVFSGTELRAKLGLRSTVFTMIPDEKGITVTTRGFGHRVGMSQYGADAMAMNGKSFQEILAHYYPGTTLELTNDRE